MVGVKAGAVVLLDHREAIFVEVVQRARAAIDVIENPELHLPSLPIVAAFWQNRRPRRRGWLRERRAGVTIRRARR